MPTARYKNTAKSLRRGRLTRMLSLSVEGSARAMVVVVDVTVGGDLVEVDAVNPFHSSRGTAAVLDPIHSSRGTAEVLARRGRGTAQDPITSVPISNMPRNRRGRVLRRSSTLTAVLVDGSNQSRLYRLVTYRGSCTCAGGVVDSAIYLMTA